MGGFAPNGVPAETANAARQTLGAAVAIAERLPNHVGAELLIVARNAFIQGLQVSALIGVIGAIGLAIFTLIFLRGEPPGGDTEFPLSN